MPASLEPSASSLTASPRVLIVEDDDSTRLLLETLIRRLWPKSRIDGFAEIQGALSAWREQGADLALVDIELPGAGGLTLVEQIAKTANHQTVPVIISHHNDRAVVLKAMRYGVRDYIVKPFNARDLMHRLASLMQFTLNTSSTRPGAKPTDPPELERLIRDAIGFRRLSLPIAPHVAECIETWHVTKQFDPALILEQYAMEPALVARTLGIANSGAYNADGQVIEDFAQALKRLNPAVLCNLTIALALQPGNPLKAPELCALAEEVRATQEKLRHRVQRLVTKTQGVDPARCLSACALYRLGELALLQLIQAWAEQGGVLQTEEVARLLKRYASEADEAIKTQWLIPRQMRELSKVTDEPPAAVVSQDVLVLRIAALQLEHEDSDDIRQLKKRLGLPPEPSAVGTPPNP